MIHTILIWLVTPLHDYHSGLVNVMMMPITMMLISFRTIILFYDHWKQYYSSGMMFRSVNKIAKESAEQ